MLERYEYWETQYQDGCVCFVLAVQPDWIKCPACGSKDITRKGRRFRELQTVYYTRRLEAFVNDLRGLMTVRDLAVITGLSWDTVKHIVHLLQNGNPIENCSVPIGSCGRGLRL